MTRSTTAARRRRRTRTARTGADRWSAVLASWSIVLLVVFGVLPQIVVGLIGLVRGDIPAEGVLGAGDGYPLFQPPFWLLWAPALLMLAAAVVSIREDKPTPLLLWPARWELAIVSLVGALITFGAAVSYGGPQFQIVIWAVVPWVLAIVVFGVRGAYGLAREAWELWGPSSR